MTILVLNCGSSSIKFQLINTATNNVLASGVVERIGEDLGLYTYKSEKYTKKRREIIVPDHNHGIELILGNLMNAEHGVITDPQEIDGVGHRVVHGGEYFSHPMLIDSQVMLRLHECIDLAPLHNPAHIKGIEAIKRHLPNAPQCAVFDTAFHQTMPRKAYLYALPLEYYAEHKIRRYGFHGTSHDYVSKQAAQHLDKDISELKIITCHIGNGASITAIDGGKSVDTSMGFTPLEGLVMGTRSGDIDPAIVHYMVKKLGMSIDEANSVLNKKSGMLGLSALTNDMREIEEEVLSETGNPDAKTAHDVYAYRIRKYIGAYMAAMNGLDVLVFTGGVGENMPILRWTVCQNLDRLGIKMDEKANNRFGDGIFDLHTADSAVKILKVPTNEELKIAIETAKLLS